MHRTYYFLHPKNLWGIPFSFIIHQAFSMSNLSLCPATPFFCKVYGKTQWWTICFFFKYASKAWDLYVFQPLRQNVIVWELHHIFLFMEYTHIYLEKSSMNVTKYHTNSILMGAQVSHGTNCIFLVAQIVFGNASARVSINGNLSTSFCLSRSTRQGGPLAHLLYAIAADKLNWLV